MEHHPIPQDITGFQFKLIGEMTVKQFAYLATGAVLAVVTFYTPLFFLLKVIFVFFFAGLGAALAFMPVEGRPLDVMLSFYLKALFAPTQYVYQKTGRSLPKDLETSQMHAPIPAPQMTPQMQAPMPQLQAQAPVPPPEQPLEDFLASIHEQNKQAIATQQSSQTVSAPQIPHAGEVSSVTVQQTVQPDVRYDTGNTYSYAQHGAQIVTMHGDEPKQQEQKSKKIDEETEQVAPPQTETIDKVEADLEKEELKVQKELAEAKLLEQQQQTQDTSKAAHERTLSLEEKLQEIASQKTHLEQELMNLKKQLEASQQQVHSVADAPTTTQQVAKPTDPAKPVSQQVRQVPTAQTRSVGLPQVDDPNIIAGVVKDPRGNLLPNILVEIIDGQNNPVRAFKTNQLGQFLSATQLPNGTYRMTFEDPKSQQTFDIIEITAKGDILLPLEIVSHDAREALRKELFT